MTFDDLVFYVLCISFVLGASVMLVVGVFVWLGMLGV